MSKHTPEPLATQAETALDAAIAQAQAQVTPDLWAMVATQRPWESKGALARRVLGVTYRALYGLAVVPAAYPSWHADGAVGCMCAGGMTCPTPGKHPLLRHSPAWLPDAPPVDWLARALINPGQVAGYDAGQTTNLAVLTGQRSAGGLLVADVDTRSAGELDALRARGWPVDATWRERTGGAGAHVYARWPLDGPVPNRPDYDLGIELKGDGCLVIVAPSRHASGRYYQWEPGLAPWERPLATLPTAVAQDIATFASAHAHAHAHAHPRVSAATRMTAAAQERTQERAHDRSLLVYSLEETRERINALFDEALAMVNDGEHRNNVAFWLGLRLGLLGLTADEITTAGQVWEGLVR